MADFCTLCGYGDINLFKLYNDKMKRELVKEMPTLKDGSFLYASVDAICCETCGLVGIGIDNKYQVTGNFDETETNHIIGHVDPETLELVLTNFTTTELF